MEGGPPSFTPGSTSQVLLWIADGNGGRPLLHTGLSPSPACLSRHFCWRCLCNSSRLPQPPPEGGFGLFRFRSPLLTESRLISFPPGTEMFQFPGLASSGLCIHPPITPSACTVTLGCPIRTSPDQGPFDGSPELFAAYHVLLRLSTPRHPPCALSSLTTFMRCCHLMAGTRPATPHRAPTSLSSSGLPALNHTRRPMRGASGARGRQSVIAVSPEPHHASPGPRPKSRARRSASTLFACQRAGATLPGRRRQPTAILDWLALAAKPLAAFLCPADMEPTGFEPATSWLQTRRSPS